MTRPPVHRRSVALASGGTVSVTIVGNVLDLSAKDRAFVFSVLGKLEAYRRSRERAEEAEAVAMGLIDLGGEA